MNNKKQKTILKDAILNFNAQLCLLRKACESNITGKAQEVKILLASACSTGTSLVILGDKPEYFYLESMMLSRSFLEKIINYCYLQICSDSEYEKFLLHPWLVHGCLGRRWQLRKISLYIFFVIVYAPIRASV